MTAGTPPVRTSGFWFGFLLGLMRLTGVVMCLTYTFAPFLDRSLNIGVLGVGFVLVAGKDGAETLGYVIDRWRGAPSPAPPSPPQDSSSPSSD